MIVKREYQRFLEIQGGRADAKREVERESGLTAKTGKAVSEIQTPCKNHAPANLVGDFLISSKRESDPAL